MADEVSTGELRRVEAILIRLEAKIDKISEAHGDTKSRVAVLEQRVDAHAENERRLSKDLEKLDQQITGIDGRLRGTEQFNSKVIGAAVIGSAVSGGLGAVLMHLIFK